MPMIRPSSDIRNCYNEISDYCKKNNEPVFITKNGSSDLVVLSNELFDKLMARLELHLILDEGIPANEAFAGIEKELIGTCSVGENERIFSMALNNKLGITNSAELAKAEEQLTKKRAAELFENNLLASYEVGTYKGLKQIHEYLFQDVYDFAGTTRTVNISKGGFRFAPVMYLDTALENISKMPQTNFDEIVEKYVEMNVAHPFREGNGRSARIWLDQILKKELGIVIDWSLIDKEDYLSAMERSPINDLEIKHLLNNALTDKVEDRDVYMKGIDISYYYEGYNAFPMSK